MLTPHVWICVRSQTQAKKPILQAKLRNGVKATHFGYNRLEPGSDTKPLGLHNIIQFIFYAKITIYYLLVRFVNVAG